jgi:imidazolonepropionase-like amidohydrolase
MRSSLIGLSLWLLLGSSAMADATQTVALIGGTLIDGNGGRPLRDAAVLIRGERIVAVGPAGEIDIPTDAKRYDVKGKYVLPGFIDMHVHLMYPPDDREQTESLSALRALHFMELLVGEGITSVRDTGGTIESMQALNQAQDLGYIHSLRLHSVGQLITTPGGHGTSWSYFTSGPDGFREGVRKMHAAGFRQIKLSPPYTEEEVSAGVDEAKKLGMRVTSHGGGRMDTEPSSMIKRAVLAGVQCIEHLNKIPLDVLDMMAERGIYLIPTLEILRTLYETPELLPSMEHLMKERGYSMAMHDELFRQARKRHITMGVGTDAAGLIDKLYPGMYVTEMEHFVRLGMSRSEAITAATKNGALILGREAELGTLEQGKLADLQVVDGNPLESFQGLGHPLLVMIGGAVLRDTPSKRAAP